MLIILLFDISIYSTVYVRLFFRKYHTARIGSIIYANLARSRCFCSSAHITHSNETQLEALIRSGFLAHVLNYFLLLLSKMVNTREIVSCSQIEAHLVLYQNKGQIKMLDNDGRGFILIV